MPAAPRPWPRRAPPFVLGDFLAQILAAGPVLYNLQWCPHGRLHSLLPRRPLLVLAVAVVLLLLDDGLAGRVAVDPDAIAVVLSALIALTAMRGPRHPQTRDARGGLRHARPGPGSQRDRRRDFARRWNSRRAGSFAMSRPPLTIAVTSHGRSGSGAETRTAEGSASGSSPKAPGALRMAVVGDSFAFGNGIAWPTASRTCFRRMLPERCEVLNFGVPGDNTVEHGQLNWHESGPFCARLHPGPVVCQRRGVDEVAPTGQSVAGLGRARMATEHSAAYTLFDSWWTRRQALGQTRTSYAAISSSASGSAE